MKRTILIQKEKYQDVSLGELRIPELDVITGYSSLAPYARKTEDAEVILRHPQALRERQPIEINGFAVPSILKKAITLQEDIQEEGSQSSPTPYENLTLNHPIVVSYPPEVIWLAKEGGIEKWVKGLTHILPLTDFGFNAKQIVCINEQLSDSIRSGQQTYNFWRTIINKKIEGESLSKIIMEWCIQNTIHARGKWMAGLTPLIDQSTTGSINLSHRINLAYGYLIDDKQNNGIKTPAPFYTINLNSSMIQPDDWSISLENIVKNARIAMMEDKFDGIFLFVRGIERISSSNGRVNTLIRLMKKLNGISRETTLPTWYSRFNFAGLRALDMGASFSSYQINLNSDDVYTDGFPGEEMHKFGMVVQPTMREIWNKDQVIRSKSGPDGGLPHLENYCSKNTPTAREEDSPIQWRIHFSKPYNIAYFSNINDEWLKNIRAGEREPGREYLRSFEAPYNTWGS